MNHANDNMQQEQDAALEIDLYDRWAAFFCPLIDKPGVAKALCELGMKIVRREAQPGARIREKVLSLLGNQDPQCGLHPQPK